MLAEGRIDVSPMVTDVVSLDELPEAFEALRTPSHQCKVLTRLLLIRIPVVIDTHQFFPAVVEGLALQAVGSQPLIVDTLARGAIVSLASGPTGYLKCGLSDSMAWAMALGHISGHGRAHAGRTQRNVPVAAVTFW